jgi:hypothetical protein
VRAFCISDFKVKSKFIMHYLTAKDAKKRKEIQIIFNV